MDHGTVAAYREILAHIRQIWKQARSRERRLSTILIAMGVSGWVALGGAVSLFSWSPVGVGFLAVGGVSGLILVVGIYVFSYSMTVLTPPLRERLLQEATTFLRERAYDDATVAWVLDRAFAGWVDIRMPKDLRARHYLIKEAIIQVRPAPEADVRNQSAHAAPCPHCGSMLTLTILDGTSGSS